MTLLLVGIAIAAASLVAWLAVLSGRWYTEEDRPYHRCHPHPFDRA